MATPTEAQFRRYRGRFAPSPTGPLHFGSLVAAVGSFLSARSCGGDWLVRIDDLDPPREVRGAAGDILRTLERFGLHWDQPVVYQSQRHDAYASAIAQLQDQGLTYACTCSRSQIAASARHGRTGLIYPGTCRARDTAPISTHAVRIRTNQGAIEFTDALRDLYRLELREHIGDFVVRRRGGLFAYHLATAVDDAMAGVTEVVRGNDLLHSTPCQIYLQQCLGLATPMYAHLPVVLNRHGQKLSKQSHANPISHEHPTRVLAAALVFLNHPPPEEARCAKPRELLRWAIANWDLRRLLRSKPSATPVDHIG